MLKPAQTRVLVISVIPITPVLLHTMAYFYVVSCFVISKWR